MKTSEYLYPADLLITDSQIEKMLLISTCNGQSFIEEFKKINHHLIVDFTFLNLTSPLPDIDDLSQYQMQYIQIPIRYVIGDKILRYESFRLDYSILLQESKDRLKFILDFCMTYNLKSGLLSIVSNFIIPQSLLSPSLNDLDTKYDLRWLISELNHELALLVPRYKNCYIGDSEGASSTIGKRWFLDDPFSFSTHNGMIIEWCDSENNPKWESETSGRIESVPSVIGIYEADTKSYFELIYAQLNYIYRLVNQIDTVKIVIFDLDNTIWRGQIGEHYDDGKTWPDFHGWPVGIWETIQILRKRGIIVSICSKNDENIVKNRWERGIPLNWTKFEDFIAPKINWNSKSENIKQILQDLSITAKSAVFVDDNPVERSEVKASIPGIRVIGSNPYLTRRILNWSSETSRASINQESLNRENSYKGIVIRNDLEKSLNRDQFLESLSVNISINRLSKVSDNKFSRSLELLNKTNQFNTTGIKWTVETLNNFITTDGAVYTINASDRFSEYGLTGVLIESAGVIRQFVMSCRILGMEIDKAILAAVCNTILEKHKMIVAAIIKTNWNSPCQNVYLNAGFLPAQDEGLFILQEKLNSPKHVTISMETS